MVKEVENSGLLVKRIQIALSSLTGTFFLFHMVLMSLLLMGWVEYRSWYPMTGIMLLVVVIVHSIVSIYCFVSKNEKREAYRAGKMVTGILMVVLLIFHGRDFTSGIGIGSLTINKGIPVLMIELGMLCFSVIHLRLGVRAVYGAMNVTGQRAERIITMSSCIVATAVLIFGGCAIWKYLM